MKLKYIIIGLLLLWLILCGLAVNAQDTSTNVKNTPFGTVYIGNMYKLGSIFASDSSFATRKSVVKDIVGNSYFGTSVTRIVESNDSSLKVGAIIIQGDTMKNISFLLDEIARYLKLYSAAKEILDMLKLDNIPEFVDNKQWIEYYRYAVREYRRALKKDEDTRKAQYKDLYDSDR